MIYSAKSDVGKIRPNNEDAYLIKNENGLYVFLVCDGMGGHKKGEVASQMARDFVEEFDFSFEGKTDDEILQILRDLVNKANIKIYLKGKNDDEMRGMGTTFSLAILYNKKIFYAHIGDSRIYVLKDKLLMISKDHTLIGELIEKGVVLNSKDRADLKNYITQALGSSSIVEPAIGSIDATDVKKIFICSDGVTTYLDDETIEKFVQRDECPQKIVDAIVDEALKLGGRDNITCLIAEIGD